MEDVFLHKEGIDYTQLKLTEEGVYSVTRQKDAERAIALMRSTVGDLKTKTITDATGCVGGDTLHFANEFRHVCSIELNDHNFKALQSNVQLYGFTNVDLYHGDATKLFKWKSDVLYIDPPWGGPGYKEQKVLNLYLSDKRLDHWLEEILLQKIRPKFIFLKLPYNYNFTCLNFLSNVEHIKPYKIRGYVFVSIIVHQVKTNL
jgi:hypothetical protein